MKLCTCNKCGNVWEDMNPGKESTEYPDHLLFPQLERQGKDVDSFWSCPVCQDDGYLVDNINYDAIPRIDSIILKELLEGVICSEDDSAWIKGWLRETIIQPGTRDVWRLETIQMYFPTEYGEYLDELF